MADMIKVVIKNPGFSAKTWEIENRLETLQDIGDGYIEMIPISKTIVLIVNEEGKLKGLPVNFYLRDLRDYIVGPAIFAGVKGEDLTSLSDSQAKRLMKELEA